MDHEFGWQVVSFRDLGLPRLTAVKRSALCQQLRPCGLVDGAVYAATAQQSLVGGVYNGIHLHFRDVVSDDLKRHRAPPVV